MYTATLLLITGVVTLVAGLPQDAQLVQPRGFECPDNYGVYEDPYQCDKFWECEEGISKARLCDDGLVFDIFKANAGSADPCESPYVVDCEDRLELQEPTFVSDQCPRRNGIFADPDPTICGRFYTCIKGHGTPTDCSAGLHFDETNGNCAWPLGAGRTGCSTHARACMGDFCCPDKEVMSADGVKIPHPTYPNLEDCQRFYVCLNGQTPQESSCTLGQVYNEQSMLCDYPENVPECTGWYRDHPQFAEYYEYDDTLTGTDIGAQDAPRAG